ncbi:MAG: site-2 protease family protein [Planctomycetota bacterium]
MPTLPEALGTVFDLAIVVLGFSTIVVIHELGHFLAARWAKIRVLAFAVGFGPALLSYRKGLGLRRGSSEAEYHDKLGAELAKHSDRSDHAAVRDEVARSLSPTEYRLNALPLGGYVRMLGQEDLNPGAVSEATDSYQSVPVYKRMVVISAGVIFNLITAAVMFVLVFMVGLEVEPSKIGYVRPGSPAAAAGLQTGDTVLSIDGDAAQRFDDVSLATAMAKAGSSLEFVVDRPGVAEPIALDVEPQKGRLSGLLEIGVGPAQTVTIADPGTQAGRDEARQLLAREGLVGVEPGMTLVGATIDGEAVETPAAFTDVIALFTRAGPAPVVLTFRGEDGASVEVETRARAELEQGLVKIGTGFTAIEHVAGLVPVMSVAEDTEPAQGLEAGDVFARIDGTEFPSPPRGLYEVRGSRGEEIDLRLLRSAGDGQPRASVPLMVSVSRAGTVGFFWDHTARSDTLLAATPTVFASVNDDMALDLPAEDLSFRPGSRVVAVNGEAVETLIDVRGALVRAIESIQTEGVDEPTAAEVGVELRLAGPATVGDAGAGDATPTYIETLVLDAESVARIMALGWEPPFSSALFEAEQTFLKAGNPVAAVGMGLHETKRVILSTYLTFARLFQGTVRVEHLKGPVGIAHIGTIVAGRGFVWLVFFFALISVNLAVINFLPLPIVDGGQFLMLLYEQFAGKPLPIAVQNGLTLIGLLGIGTIFLIVTFNDLRSLIGF